MCVSIPAFWVESWKTMNQGVTSSCTPASLIFTFFRFLSSSFSHFPFIHVALRWRDSHVFNPAKKKKKKRDVIEKDAVNSAEIYMSYLRNCQYALFTALPSGENQPWLTPAGSKIYSPLHFLSVLLNQPKVPMHHGAFPPHLAWKMDDKWWRLCIISFFR